VHKHRGKNGAEIPHRILAEARGNERPRLMKGSPPEISRKNTKTFAITSSQVTTGTNLRCELSSPIGIMGILSRSQVFEV
jgi:hypothetical protein